MLGMLAGCGCGMLGMHAAQLTGVCWQESFSVRRTVKHAATQLTLCGRDNIEAVIFQRLGGEEEYTHPPR